MFGVVTNWVCSMGLILPLPPQKVNWSKFWQVCDCPAPHNHQWGGHGIWVCVFISVLDKTAVPPIIGTNRQTSICSMIDSVTFAKAIADGTRQHIMQLLCCEWLCVNDVVDKLGGSVTQPTVSHHLSILRDAGLVAVRREGKQVFYSLNQEAVAICCGEILQVFAPEIER